MSAKYQDAAAESMEGRAALARGAHRSDYVPEEGFDERWMEPAHAAGRHDLVGNEITSRFISTPRKMFFADLLD